MHFSLFSINWKTNYKSLDFILFSFGPGTEKSVFGITKVGTSIVLEVVGMEFVFSNE